MTPILVTGLPRSRTAWMAVALSCTGRLCVHEPLAGLSRLEQVWGVWDRPGVFGVSDSSFSLFLGRALDRVRPRTLVVRRPIGEVGASLRRAGVPVSTMLELMEERLHPWLSHPLVKVVDFEDLSDLDLLDEVWRHLGADPLPHQQLEQLTRMRVTVRQLPSIGPAEILAFNSLLEEVGVDSRSIRLAA